MSEGEANEFSYVRINYEYDIQADKSSWLPKEWDISFWNHWAIDGSGMGDVTTEKCEERRMDYYGNNPIFKEEDS